MIIGLTGGTGSGKSSVAAILRGEYGAHIIDADAAAHRVILKTGAAYAGVVAEFGGGILSADGEIDRRRLGALVFGDAKPRARLTEITHKHIIADMLAELERERASRPHVVMDAPLLVEAGLHKHCGRVWLVHAAESIRLARITARDAITESEAKNRADSQARHAELLKYADAVIENSGDMEGLRAEVRRLMDELMI